MTFEMKLGRLFDYQRFEGNSGLQQVISAVHAKYPMQDLTLDEMDTVAAAGRPYEKKDSKKDPLA